MLQTPKYKNRYRIKSIRLEHWNYANDGYYYVTICVKNFKPIFGKVVDDQVQLSHLGLSARSCWLEIPNHFPFVKLDECIIMPNHLHGILIFDRPLPVETQNFASLPLVQSKPRFGPQSQNLASVIRGFKIGVTKFARIHDLPFSWQPRFYEHMIRTEKAYIAIQKYIRNNPLKWHLDELSIPAS